ncbi:MAG TPA: diacylglycerol kinase family protein [Gaiellaceae bacterium]|nr:diacylglycerol kinase family protein [Gaiellaceae bacterium]
MARDRVVFLVNPASANGSTGRAWPELAHRAAAAGLEGETLTSDGPGGIVRVAERAAGLGAERVVVVGGDGSVNEAASGLLAAGAGREVELAVIPRGTGTDFIRTFGIPKKLDDAIAVARDGKAREIDAGRVCYRAWDGSQGSAHFVNVASAGMSGAVAMRANSSSKALGGKASFLWATLAVFARWTNSEVAVDVDDVHREGRMLDVIVANCEWLGGGMHMTPKAEPDDGLFDVLLIGDITKRDLVQTLPKIYRGTHLPHPKAEEIRGHTVRVDAPTALPVELDGEQPGTTPATFEVLPRALRLVVPV